MPFPILHFPVCPRRIREKQLWREERSLLTWEPNGIVPVSVAVSGKRGECGVGPATLEPEWLDPVSLAAF